VIFENKKTKFLILLALATTLISSCSKFGAFDNRISEGTIEYEVTFPYLDDEVGLLKSLLPDKMILNFKDDKYVSEMSTVGGMFKNRFISNQDEKQLAHELKVFKKKIVVSYDLNGVNRLLNTLPTLSIIETNETDTIAGYACKKAIGIFDQIGMPEMTIYYTDGINIDNPNWCTQFHSIEGVLLQYEVEQFGVRMRFRANSVTSVNINNDMLKKEADYEEVSYDVMETELEQILDTFNF
jgi:GLPGLI family protein